MRPRSMGYRRLLSNSPHYIPVRWHFLCNAHAKRHTLPETVGGFCTVVVVGKPHRDWPPFECILHRIEFPSKHTFIVDVCNLLPDHVVHVGILHLTDDDSHIQIVTHASLPRLRRFHLLPVYTNQHPVRMPNGRRSSPM